MDQSFRTLRVVDGMIRVPTEGPVEIDPPASIPARYGPGKARWALTPELVGMMERICRARFDVQQLLPTIEDDWTEVQAQGKRLTKNGDPINLASSSDVIESIAQSVYASTKIEGEEVYAKDVPLAIVGRVDPRASAEDDYPLRIKGAQETYKAYIWALSRPTPLAGGGVISSDFIVELHERMFSASKPDVAGKLKSVRNQIAIGERILLRMLPPERAAEFLTRLCDRLNSQFLIADNSGRYSKLMAVGEFIVDFLAIHPFGDGNGRIARLLSTYLLERAGFRFARFYSLDSVILDRHVEYYQVLLDSQRAWYTNREDLSPWIGFYLSCVFSQWLRAHEEILRRRATRNGA